VSGNPVHAVSSLARPVGEFLHRPLPAGTGDWISYNRRISAGVGVVGLLGLGIGENAEWAEHLALFVLLILAISTALGWVEATPRHRRDLLVGSVEDQHVRRHWMVAIGVLILSSGLAAQTWFLVGTSIATGDIAPPDGTAWIGRLFAPSAWSGSNLGGISQLQLRLPWAAVLGFVHLLGGSAALAQRAWYTILFVAAALACLAFLAVLGAKPLPSVVGSLAYAFSPYVVSFVYTNPVFLAAMALLAFLPALVLAAARAKLRIPTSALLIGGIGGPMLGYVYQNPPLVGMIIGALLVSPLLAGWAFGKTASQRGVRSIALGVPLLLLLSSYWIVPAIVSISSAATQQLASLPSWTWTEARANLRNAFWLNTHWGWSYAEYYPFAGTYAQAPLAALKFGLPALAFAALTRKRLADTQKLPIAIAASTVALFLIFVSTGTNPPGNVFFMPLYHLPYGWLLREPGRFLMVVGLAYSVLIAVFIHSLLSHERTDPALSTRKWSKVVIPSLNRLNLRSIAIAAAASVLIVLPAFPLFTGSIVPTDRPTLPPAHVRVPSYWLEMAAFSNRLGTPGAAVILPPDDFYQMPYDWGYYGTDSFIPELFSRPVLIPNGQGYYPAANQLLSAIHAVSASLLSGHWQEAQKAMEALHAPFILVRGDVQTSFPGRNIVSPQLLADALQNAPNFTLVHQAGSLELFSLRTSIPPAPEVVSKTTVAIIQLGQGLSALGGAMVLVVTISSATLWVKRRVVHGFIPAAED
jgi:arabinofuranan 3-O-arabinosyltransferase